MMFRKAVKADMIEIAKINIACVPNGTRAKWGAELTARFYECYFEEHSPMIVAEENELIVGYVMGYFKGSTARKTFEQMRGKVWQEMECFDPTKDYDCVLLSLAVHPNYSGKGIAKGLVSHFLQMVYTQGKAKNCCLETQTYNIAAQHVYEACGFIEILRADDSVWYALDILEGE